ncbi:MAG TPA: hypothetical protein VGG25_15000 [Streptosporangiaceae bacterium]
MRNSTRSGLLVTAATVTALLAVSPAALAQATVSPEGFGMESTRATTVPPTPLANPTTPAPAGVPSVTASGVVTATTLTASVSTNQAQARVGGLNTSGMLLPLFGTITTGGATTASCVANSNGTFTLTSSVTNLNIGGTTFNGMAAANFTLINNILVGKVILNEQAAGPVAGSETVNAIDFQPLLGSHIYIASATCGPWASPVPVASGKGLLLGLGLLGSVGVAWTRRRNRAPLRRPGRCAPGHRAAG